jgi:hypothetical protein
MLTVIRQLKTDSQKEAFLWQVSEAQKMFKEIWVHADCNIYVDDQDKESPTYRTGKDKSDFRAANCSPQVESSKWRCCLKKNDKTPETLEDLEKLMMAAREADRQKDIAKQTGEVPSLPKMPVKALVVNKEKENGTKNS